MLLATTVQPSKRSTITSNPLESVKPRYRNHLSRAAPSFETKEDRLFDAPCIVRMNPIVPSSYTSFVRAWGTNGVFFLPPPPRPFFRRWLGCTTRLQFTIDRNWSISVSRVCLHVGASCLSFCFHGPCVLFRANHRLPGHHPHLHPHPFIIGF